MRYTDGREAMLGDRVIISGIHPGLVVANIDGQEYSPMHPKEQWEHLDSGILIDTDFGGTIHYQQFSLGGESIELLERA